MGGGGAKSAVSENASVVGDDDDNTTVHNSTPSEGETDGVKEIQAMVKKETIFVGTWRIILTILLAATGVAVCVTSYVFLHGEEEANFETAYSQFSRTLANAAQDEVLRLREGVKTFADEVTSTADLMNTTWPFYDYDKLFVLADEQVQTKNLEGLHFVQRVPFEDRADYVQLMNNTMGRWTVDGHNRYYGNTDFLVPAGFQGDISALGAEGFGPAPEKDEYFVFAFRHPPPNSYFLIGVDVTSFGYDDLFASIVYLKNETLISNVNPFIATDDNDAKYHSRFHSQVEGSEVNFPHSFMFHPVHAVFDDHESPVVGLSYITMAWDASFRNLLPEGVRGMIAVGHNNCTSNEDQAFSYEVIGPATYYLGEGDLHDRDFDDFEVIVNLDYHTHSEFMEMPGHCAYSLSIYPSKTFRDDYITNSPTIFVCIVAATFLLMIAAFYIYDYMVQIRNNKLVIQAAQSNEIVASLFPGALRDKILTQKQEEYGRSGRHHATSKMKAMMPSRDVNTDVLEEMKSSNPLAELYLNCSVVFADVVGFTAWSSSREPQAVFKLLETVFQSFDTLARRRKVFKVETVGDCFVGIAGFPDPQADHAIRMVRFANDCIHTFATLTKKLEVVLGPDTGELALRVGVHSGQITAGVLRGDRARFQLFGDTVNTTSRIESTGKPGRIHISKDTADLLTQAGKESWLQRRSDSVVAKGKGVLNTFWVRIPGGGNKTQPIRNPSAEESESDMLDPAVMEEKDQGKEERLIEWNTTTLLMLLKQVVARREVVLGTSSLGNAAVDSIKGVGLKGATFLDEVQEIIELPNFTPSKYAEERNVKEIDLVQAVEEQLREYVECIARMYRTNPFHNFEHASHVLMSVTKLLSRIIAPADLMEIDNDEDYKAALHDHTYGITSDPLTQFACAFSALIHDVDHQGVANPRLIEEYPELGAQYKNRSVAEQNSLDLSWKLLMESRFKDLLSTLCATPEELQRFRQLAVNSVLATDIMDKDLKELRNNRWDKAFKDAGNGGPKQPGAESVHDAVNRKATIVIEHLIQASDVAHTMQHWHVYRKWNERLFEELYVACRSGRMASSPESFWAKGEIGFFDFYIIPLAKKLKDCGVFGVSSDEYLNYAIKNRNEWEVKGAEIVAAMVEKLKAKYPEIPPPALSGVFDV